MILQIYPMTERNLLLHTTVSGLKHRIYFDCHFSIEASKPTVRVKSLNCEELIDRIKIKIN